MRDFADAAMAGGVEMQQQGFKKFQRRRGRRQEQLEAYEVEHGRTAAPAADTLRNTLPARLPEPWERLRRVQIRARRHQEAGSPLVNFFREDPAAKAFDLLRTRLAQTLKARGWKRVAITAPVSGCGTTFTAVNLALSMARVPGSRTILMDMNRRSPGVQEALKLGPCGDAAGFLDGSVAMEDYLVRPADTLALGLGGAPDLNPAETLQDPACAAVLEDMVLRSGASAVLYDLPPVLEHDDLAAFLPQVDGVLLVSDGTGTTAAQLEACEKLIAGQAELLGVVLNRARKPGGALQGG